MLKYNAQNERIKRDYYIYLKEAKGKAASTIDAISKAIRRFEEHTKFKDFNTFRLEQAVAFKAHLANTKRKATGEILSLSTQLATLIALKEFFIWLYAQKTIKQKIRLNDIQYFTMSDKDISTAKAPKERPFPTIEQIQHVVACMPTATAIERRNRALIAFTALTVARDGAIASLCLRHIDTSQKMPIVHQEPDKVKTKFSKLIHSVFYSIDDNFTQIVLDWIEELKTVHLFGLDDPIFPRTRMGQTESFTFIPIGIDKIHWKTASPIREIFKQAFENAGLPYFHPHTFRHTLTHIGTQICTNGEEMKAWSQNMGHKNVSTTFNSYGNLTVTRQCEVLAGLNANPKSKNLNQTQMLEQILNAIIGGGLNPTPQAD